MDKQCIKCGEVKDYADFYSYKRKSGTTGYRNKCRTCMWKEDKARDSFTRINNEKKARLLEWKKANYEKVGIYRRRSEFKLLGVDVDEAEKLYQSHSGHCDICGNTCTSGKRLALDHCHTTGKIRGMLCGNCNTGLGKFKDSPEMLFKAIEYLRQV